MASVRSESRRVPVVVKVEVTDGAQSWPGQLSNLSATGAAIRLGVEPAATALTGGAAVTLVLPSVVRLPSVAVDRRGTNLRLQFGNLSADEQAKLAAFIEEADASTFDSFQDW